MKELKEENTISPRPQLYRKNAFIFLDNANNSNQIILINFSIISDYKLITVINLKRAISSGQGGSASVSLLNQNDCKRQTNLLNGATRKFATLLRGTGADNERLILPDYEGGSGWP